METCLKLEFQINELLKRYKSENKIFNIDEMLFLDKKDFNICRKYEYFNQLEKGIREEYI